MTHLDRLTANPPDTEPRCGICDDTGEVTCPVCCGHSRPDDTWPCEGCDGYNTITCDHGGDYALGRGDWLHDRAKDNAND